jgi:hypothetical protein
MDHVKQVGAETYFNQWLTNPNSEQLGKNHMTSWNQAKEMTRGALSSYIGLCNMDSGIVVTHGGIIEPLIARLVESGRFNQEPVRSLAEIGGSFNSNDAAYLALTRTDEGGIECSGTLERAGKSYPVNIAKFYVTPPDVP